jgi:hypothetical protein
VVQEFGEGSGNELWIYISFAVPRSPHIFQKVRIRIVKNLKAGWFWSPMFGQIVNHERLDLPPLIWWYRITSYKPQGQQRQIQIVGCVRRCYSTFSL